jgi:histidine ammonia-lyase
MGANAMLKLIRVVENVRKVIAIELFTACQALEFRGVSMSASASQTVVNKVRQTIPFIQLDTEMSPYMFEAERIINEEVF